LKRLGHVNAMTMVLIMFGMRFLIYSFIDNPWLVLPVELLNGVTFGLFYATMTSYASVIAPPGTATTIQGLVGGLFEGFGVAAGSFFGGLLFHNYGGATTYRLYGICAILFGVIHGLVQIPLRGRGPPGLAIGNGKAGGGDAERNSNELDLMKETKSVDETIENNAD